MEGVIADRFRSGPGISSSATPPIGTLRPAVWGSTRRSTMSTTCAGSWRPCCAGQAGDGLLDTYEAERKPVDQNNIDNAIANAMNHFTIDKALEPVAGEHPGAELGGTRTAVAGPARLRRQAARPQPGDRLADHGVPPPQRRVRLHATTPRRSSTTAAPSTSRWTRYASTSPAPSPDTRCPTPSSSAKASEPPWAPWSTAASSCCIAGEDGARVGRGRRQDRRGTRLPLRGRHRRRAGQRLRRRALRLAEEPGNLLHRCGAGAPRPVRRVPLDGSRDDPSRPKAVLTGALPPNLVRRPRPTEQPDAHRQSRRPTGPAGRGRGRRRQHASAGRFAADPQQIYTEWEEFRRWADGVNTETAAALPRRRGPAPGHRRRARSSRSA